MSTDKILKFAAFYETAAKKKEKGRTDESAKKQYKTMTKGKPHPFKHMYDKFKKHPEIENPAGLAAWLKDKGTGSKKWRSTEGLKGKKDKKSKKSKK